MSAPKTKPFEPGHRIIYMGKFIGNLIEKRDKGAGVQWRVEWEDGAGGAVDSWFREALMNHANGGPGSAQRGVNRLAAAALRKAAEELPYIDERNQIVRQQAAAEWLRDRASNLEGR